MERSSRITELAKLVADDVNNSGILPEGVEAEFAAFFKRDVETTSGIIVNVCPHSEEEIVLARKVRQAVFKIDVAIQYKLEKETVEDATQKIGLIADRIARHFEGKKIGFYVGLKPEYYPYHGDSLEKQRVFTSIVQATFIGAFKI